MRNQENHPCRLDEIIGRPIQAGCPLWRYSIGWPTACLAIFAVCVLAGCEVLPKPPMRIGVSSLDLSPLPPFLPKRTLFQEDLQQALKEPVMFELLQPWQIRVHLGTGRVKFAMLSTEEYAEVGPGKNSEILAVPRNSHGNQYRQGLIVVSPRSRIQKMSELKKVRFHFLPAGNPLNEAVLGALLDAGVSSKQIDKGILGLELDTSHISSLEVAKSVVLEENVAGVIDEADYNLWPDKGGSLVLLSPSKEQVRVIGKTVRVPEGPFVASLQAPAELRDRIRHYLLEEVNSKKLVLGVLGIKSFAPPIAFSEYEPYIAIHNKLHPRRLAEPKTE